MRLIILGIIFLVSCSQPKINKVYKIFFEGSKHESDTLMAENDAEALKQFTLRYISKTQTNIQLKTNLEITRAEILDMTGKNPINNLSKHQIDSVAKTLYAYENELYKLLKLTGNGD